MRQICNMWVNLRSYANRPMSKVSLFVRMIGVWSLLCAAALPLAGQAAFEQAQRLSEQNQYLEAVRVLETYIKEHPDRRYDNSRAWWLLSYQWLQLDDLAAAEAANDSSFALRAAILSDEIAENYLRSGVIALRRGHFAKALNDLNRAGDLPIEDPRLFALVFAYRGQALSELGRWEEADQAFADAREMLLIADGAEHPDLATLYYDQGRAALLRGESTRAAELLQQAWAIAERIAGRADMKGRILNALGETQVKLDHEAADRYYLKAARQFERAYGRRHRELARIHLNRADLLLAPDNRTALYRQLDSAVWRLCPELRIGEKPTENTQTLDRAMLAEALRRQAWLWADGSATDSLRTAYQLAATASGVYLGHLATLNDENDQLTYRRNWGDVFEPGIYAALRLYEAGTDSAMLHRAFALAEQAKSAILKAQLRVSALSPALDELRRSMRRAEAHWATRPSDSQAQWQARMARQTWEQAWLRVEQENPAALRDAYLSAPPSPDSLRARLAPEQAILSYYLGADYYYIFCLSGERFAAYALPNDYFHSLLSGKNKAASRIINVAAGLASAAGTYSGWTPMLRLPDLHASLDGLAQALRKNDAQAFANHAGNAYIKLVQPVRQHLNRKSELIISPHGKLGGLSFEALVVDYTPEETEEDKTVKFHRLHYLGADFSIRYVYDLARLMAPSLRPTGAWAGIAPVFDAGGGELAVVDPEARSSLPAGLSALTADGQSFVALPFSEGEVNAIAALYGKGAALRLRNYATEEWLKDSMAHYGVIHLATHSFINRLEPLLSGIALARPAGPSREDGILYAAEVAALRLNGQLAVLSSCDSGAGPDGGSEGPLSLSRSFLRAGAGGVLCSLWKVYDQHTATLMTGFYQQLAQGRMPAQALRQARSRMMRNKRTANPRLWAGFIYIE